MKTLLYSTAAAALLLGAHPIPQSAQAAETTSATQTSSEAGTPAEISVSDAWVRPGVGKNRPAALYFTLTNQGAATALTQVSSPVSDRIELHNHIHENGVMRMKKVERVEIPTSGTLEFKPMGYHVMIFKPSAAVITGAKIPVTLTLDGGKSLEIEAEVKSLSTRADDEDHSKH